FLTLVFSWAALTPLAPIAPVWILGLSGLFTILIVVWAFRIVTDPRMPSEATPDDCWYLGSLYVNRNDPAIFVQKRIGFGYTMNWGNRLTWLISGIAVAVSIVIVVLVRH